MLRQRASIEPPKAHAGQYRILGERERIGKKRAIRLKRIVDELRIRGHAERPPRGLAVQQNIIRRRKSRRRENAGQYEKNENENISTHSFGPAGARECAAGSGEAHTIIPCFRSGAQLDVPEVRGGTRSAGGFS